MKIRLKEISEIVKGKVSGNRRIEIKGISHIENAVKGDISPYFGKRWKKIINTTEASALFVYEKIEGFSQVIVGRERYFKELDKLFEIFSPKERFNEDIHSTAIIGEDVVIDRRVAIGAYSVIGNGVKIGEGTKIYPHVVIYPDVIIGKCCKIHSGVVIRSNVVVEDNVEVDTNASLGSAGFQRGFPSENMNLPSLCGKIKIEKDVFIGALTHLSKDILRSTEIKAGSKVDALVYIGHGVTIGKRCRIAGQSGFSARTEIGDEVSIGGQCGTADNIIIKDKAFIASCSGVLKNVKRGAYIVGTPATDISEWKKSELFLRKVRKKWDKVRRWLDGL